ncbi:MAG: phosphodiester glycosidase family protein [Acidobacteria bacterium]|nr:phosphodiester glycosidase family protein [Acidobacteriota bacterium]
MKKLIALIALLVLAAAVAAQDYKTVRDGVEYAELEREIDQTKVRMNLLRLDPTKVRLDVAHAMDNLTGTEKTSSIATRHGAIAAINAGFFRFDASIFAGDPAGVLMIDGKLLSESHNDRIAVLIKNFTARTDVVFAHLNVNYKLTIGKEEIEVSGIDRERKADELVLFTPEFSRTTLTDPQGVEIAVERNRITKISDGRGSTAIPADGFVISASGKLRERLLKIVKLKEKVKLTRIINAKEPKAGFDVLEAEDITNGVAQLLRNGKIDVTWEQEKASKSFYETKHPRTALAKLKDGKILMITVDGRSESSGGISLENLARLLLEFGATDAMNLDGGGSTTMFLDGRVVNHPSDKEGERRIGDAILVFTR